MKITLTIIGAGVGGLGGSKYLTLTFCFKVTGVIGRTIRTFC